MEKNEENEEMLTMAECARYGKVCRQAVFSAIQKGKLLGAKDSRGRWIVNRKDFDEYRINKYNRDMRMSKDGEYVFSIEKGLFSVSQVCKIISHHLNRPYDVQRLYYLLRTGQLKGFRKGFAWVVLAEDAQDLLEKELGINSKQMSFS